MARGRPNYSTLTRIDGNSICNPALSNFHGFGFPQLFIFFFSILGFSKIDSVDPTSVFISKISGMLLLYKSNSSSSVLSRSFIKWVE